MNELQKRFDKTRQDKTRQDKTRQYSEPSYELRPLCDLEVGGQRGIVYSTFGISPALSATQYKDANKVLVREQYALNPMPNGTCRTLKNQYYKNSISNFESTGSFGASGVIEKCQKKCWES